MKVSLLLGCFIEFISDSIGRQDLARRNRYLVAFVVTVPLPRTHNATNFNLGKPLTFLCRLDKLPEESYFCRGCNTVCFETNLLTFETICCSATLHVCLPLLLS